MTSYSGTAIIRFPVPAAKNKFAGSVALSRNPPARISRRHSLYRRIGPADQPWQVPHRRTNRARRRQNGQPPGKRRPKTRRGQLRKELWSEGTLPTVRCDPTSGVAITFCEGYMTGGTRPWSTGSLTLDFGGSQKRYRLKLD